MVIQEEGHTYLTHQVAVDLYKELHFTRRKAAHFKILRCGVRCHRKCLMRLTGNQKIFSLVNEIQESSTPPTTVVWCVIYDRLLTVFIKKNYVGYVFKSWAAI